MINIESLYFCMAAPIFIALLFMRGKSKIICAFLLAGMTICLLSASINSFIFVLTGMSADDAAIFIAPVTEESMKLLSLLFFFLLLDPDRGDLLSASVMTGVGFACFENCIYLLPSGAEDTSFILLRGLAAGVMHIICAVTMGLGIAMVRKFRKMAAVGILGVFSLIVTYHATYNLLISAGGQARIIGCMLPVFTASVMYLSIHIHEKKEQKKLPGRS